MNEISFIGSQSVNAIKYVLIKQVIECKCEQLYILKVNIFCLGRFPFFILGDTLTGRRELT